MRAAGVLDREAHHIRHWIDGGPTVVENLVPLCLRHHFMVHEGGWTIQKTGATLQFIPPSRDSFAFTEFHPANSSVG